MTEYWCRLSVSDKIEAKTEKEARRTLWELVVTGYYGDEKKIIKVRKL